MKKNKIPAIFKFLGLAVFAFVSYIILAILGLHETWWVLISAIPAFIVFAPIAGLIIRGFIYKPLVWVVKKIIK